MGPACFYNSPVDQHRQLGMTVVGLVLVPDATSGRRVGKLFDVIDRNGTGSVGVEDYEALGQRLVGAAGSHSNAPNADEVREPFKQIWGEFQKPVDKDGDGRVSKQEFIEPVRSLLSTADIERAHPRWRRETFSNVTISKTWIDLAG